MAVKTFTANEVLTSADMNTYAANSGLVYVTQASIGTTAVTTFVVANCFNSTFDNYKISISGMTHSSLNNALALKLGTGTAGSFSPTTSSWYGNTFYIALGTSGGLTNAALVNTSYAECMSINSYSGGQNSGVIELQAPYLSENSRVQYTSADPGYFRIGASCHIATNSYTGFQLFPLSGTISNGTVTVYGYRKA